MLCQKLTLIFLFLEMIDIMSEFANTELHLEGVKIEKSRNFIDKWMQNKSMVS